jgi:hypothetical protein
MFGLPLRRRTAPEAVEVEEARSVGALAKLGLAFGPVADPLTIWGLRHWFFPLSRLWAAADGNGGDVEHFLAESGLALKRQPLLGYAVKRIAGQADAKDKLDAVDEAWDAGFFGRANTRPATLAWLEQTRKRASQRWMLARIGYQPLAVGRSLPSVKWAGPSPAEVEKAFGPALADPATAFDLRIRPRVEMSGAFSTSLGRVSWLRFNSPWPRLGDRVLARVTEPPGVSNPPTIVFGNGVFVEWDMFADLSGVERLLLSRGFRVVELVSPWHGRRRPAGRYGGEAFFATAPLGPIDLFVAQALESAVLIRWARDAFGGKVAIGGISMGALAAQLGAGYADRWPRDCRPDAALLIAHSGQLRSVTFEGSLTRAIGLPTALEAANWTHEAVERVRSLLDPPPRPGIDPGTIVSMLGQVDRVMPVEQGLELIRRWGVPENNVFTVRQSHVSLPLALHSDDRPIRRLREILGG